VDAQDEGASSTLVESADPEIIAAAEAEAEAAAANEGDADSAEEDGEEQGEEEQAPEEDDAPEDDFNAAWEVLDVARTIYAKVVEEKKEKQEEYQEDDMRLADCYLFLGDVSCETGTFPRLLLRS
jgi:HAT1-interacting factor 1